MKLPPYIFPDSKKIIEYLLVSIAGIIPFFWILGFRWTDLEFPFGYDGDALLSISLSKTLIEQGWLFGNNKLGAPYGQLLTDIPFFEFINILILKVMTLFSSDAVRALNLYFLTSFSLTTVASYFVCKQLSFEKDISLWISLLFSYQYYHLARGIFHLFLSMYFVVPLGFWLLFQLFDPSIIKKKASTYTLMFMSAICGLCGLYYAIFILFLMAAFLVAEIIFSPKNTKKIQWACFFILGSALFATVFPTLISSLTHGPAAKITRSPSDIENYALKFTHLVLPVEGHYIESLALLKQRYLETTYFNNENKTAVLGFVGTVGFIFGWLFLIATKAGDQAHHILNRVAKINVLLFLFATLGGITAVVGLLTFPMIRSSNRVSVFIAFGSLLIVGMGLEKLRKYWPQKHLFSVLIFLVGGFLILDQTGSAVLGSAFPNRAVTDDRAFVRALEHSFANNSKIFQLPYVPFWESGPTVQLEGYEHLRPYLFSKTFSWSYGGTRGREADVWYANTARLPIMTMLNELKSKNFTAIYVDRRGFSDHANSILAELTRILGAPVVSDQDSIRLVFRIQ